MLNNPNEWHNIEEDLENSGNEEIAVEKSVQPEGAQNANNSKIKIGLLILGLILIAAIAIAKQMGSKNSELASINPTSSPMSSPIYDDSTGQEPMAVVDVNLNDSPGGIEIDSQQMNPANGTIPIAAAPMPAAGGSGELVIASKQITNTDKYDFNKQAIEKGLNKGTVVVSVGNEGRPNPFFPFKEKKHTGISYPGGGNVNFDIIEPPPSVIPDPQATQMLQTVISGIMYDTRNPSAIININGTDQLVRKSDKLGNYTILDITKDKVVIKSGTNIYRASVGQTIASDDSGFNSVSNLRHKFGGAYSPVPSNYLNFNAN